MKNFIAIFIALLLVFTIGCSGTTNNNKTKKPSDNIQPKNEIKYSVKNDGGKFSKNDLIYFIMTDRFNDGDLDNNNFNDVNKKNPSGYHGGDFKGIIEKLDYIKSLGATTIWITPVVANESYGYHGYWISDFYAVNKHFGSMEDLKNLVNEAHNRDIKIILDHVVNHTGYKHIWLKDKSKNDWFHPRKNITNWNIQEQVEKGWLAGLPDLNQDNPEVREYLLENTLWWIEETGVDGMRLDTVRHVSKDFWNEFAYKIKSKHPDFYLLGEVWNENPRYIEQYHALGIDGMTNYSLYRGIRNAFTRYGKTNSLISAIDNEKHFSNPEINGVFIDNHDNTRLITSAGENGENYLKQALSFIMTYPSIPVIYYGTEIGMEGGKDPDNRRDMEWEKVQDSDMLDFYKKLSKLRQSNQAIIDGDFTILDSDTYYLAYERKLENESIVIILNLQNKNKEVTINLSTNSESYIDYLTGEEFKPINKALNINIEPYGILILQNSK